MTNPDRLSLRRTLVAAVVVAACLGCGTDDPDRSEAVSTPPTTEAQVAAASPGCELAPDDSPRATHERVDMTSGGDDRWYTRFLPTSYDGSPAPLVIDLHGYLSGSAGQIAMSDLAKVAEAEGFVLVTPQGTSDMPYWNAVPHDDLPDDVGFVEDVIDDVAGETCIDPARVYVDGFSNGAFLASLVACQLADRVAAVATIAGLMLPADCSPSRPVPIVAMHGTEDRYVSFAGAPNAALDELTWNEQSTAAFDGLAFADVTDTTAEWAELQGCAAEPEREAVSANVERVAYGDCDGESTVELYVAQGAGHTWPGSDFAAASEPILGPPTDEIDASATIWTFFSNHSLP